MAKVHLTMTLPKVGDRLMRTMSATVFGLDATYEPKECVVTYVNKPHQWYEVEFVDSGIRESFGVPVIDHSILLGCKAGTVPVVCIETATAYSSIVDCANDIGYPDYLISKQIVHGYGYRADYHFLKVL